MPATTEKQARFFRAVAHGALPPPPGMSVRKARDFMHVKRKAHGGVVDDPREREGLFEPQIDKERFAQGGVTDGNVYAQMTREVARKYFGDSPLADTFYRLIQQESGFAPDVVTGARRSTAGAMGIAQFMKGTADAMGINPLDPAQALDGAARYLKQNIDYFGGDVAKGVAAYNAGPGGVQQAVARGGQNWVSALPAETQSYLSIIRPGQTVTSGEQRQGTSTQQTSTTTNRTTTTRRERSPIIDQLESQYQDLLNQRAQAVAAGESTGNLDYSIDKLGAALKNAYSTQGLIKEEDGNSIENRTATQALAVQGYQQLANVIHTAFGDNLALEQFLLTSLQHNTTELLREITTGVSTANLSLEQATAKVAAQASLQTAEVARAAEALKLAGFINEKNWEMTLRELPPGTPYQPGLGPSDALAQAMRGYGLTPTVVPTVSVPRSRLDPVANYQQAQQALGVPKPAFDVAGIDAVKGQIAAIPQYSAVFHKPQTEGLTNLAGGYEAVGAGIVGAMQPPAPAPPPMVQELTPVAPPVQPSYGITDPAQLAGVEGQIQGGDDWETIELPGMRLVRPRTRAGVPGVV